MYEPTNFLCGVESHSSSHFPIMYSKHNSRLQHSENQCVNQGPWQMAIKLAALLHLCSAWSPWLWLSFNPCCRSGPAAWILQQDYDGHLWHRHPHVTGVTAGGAAQQGSRCLLLRGAAVAGEGAEGEGMETGKWMGLQAQWLLKLAGCK